MHKKKRKVPHPFLLAFVVLPLAAALALGAGPAGMPAPPSGSAGIQKIPASWKDGDGTDPIYVPSPNWDEAFRQNDLAELEEAYERASAPKGYVPPASTCVPWEERPVVYSWEAGIRFDTRIATCRVPRFGISQAVRWDFRQESTDDPYTMNIWGYSGLFGELEHWTLLYDHNYQTGRWFAQLVPGDLVYVDASWGSYVYRCVGQRILVDDWETEKSVPRYISSRCDTEMTFQGDFWDGDHPGGYVMEACRSDPVHMARMYMVTCWPLDQWHTDHRLLVEFECISGPRLVW